MTIRGYAGRVPGTCGVGLYYLFNDPPSYYYSVPRDALVRGGIGYAIAGFVDTPNCKVVYDKIKKDHKIVFQSPVKNNRNSGREFFFIVYTKKGK